MNQQENLPERAALPSASDGLFCLPKNHFSFKPVGIGEPSREGPPVRKLVTLLLNPKPVIFNDDYMTKRQSFGIFWMLASAKKRKSSLEPIPKNYLRLVLRKPTFLHEVMNLTDEQGERISPSLSSHGSGPM